MTKIVHAAWPVGFAATRALYDGPVSHGKWQIHNMCSLQFQRPRITLPSIDSLGRFPSAPVASFLAEGLLVRIS